MSISKAGELMREARSMFGDAAGKLSEFSVALTDDEVNEVKEDLLVVAKFLTYITLGTKVIQNKLEADKETLDKVRKIEKMVEDNPQADLMGLIDLMHKITGQESQSEVEWPEEIKEHTV